MEEDNNKGKNVEGTDLTFMQNINGCTNYVFKLMASQHSNPPEEETVQLLKEDNNQTHKEELDLELTLGGPNYNKNSKANPVATSSFTEMINAGRVNSPWLVTANQKPMIEERNVAVALEMNSNIIRSMQRFMKQKLLRSSTSKKDQSGKSPATNPPITSSLQPDVVVWAAAPARESHALKHKSTEGEGDKTVVLEMKSNWTQSMQQFEQQQLLRRPATRGGDQNEDSLAANTPMTSSSKADVVVWAAAPAPAPAPALETHTPNQISMEEERAAMVMLDMKTKRTQSMERFVRKRLLRNQSEKSPQAANPLQIPSPEQDVAALAAASASSNPALRRGIDHIRSIKANTGSTSGNENHKGKGILVIGKPPLPRKPIPSFLKGKAVELAKPENPSKKAKASGAGGSAGAWSDIPRKQVRRVRTTGGNGPDCREVEGCLYIDEGGVINLVCYCHGAFFTPKQFVEHAGGKDVENPFKHILVSAFDMVNA